MKREYMLNSLKSWVRFSGCMRSRLWIPAGWSHLPAVQGADSRGWVLSDIRALTAAMVTGVSLLSFLWTDSLSSLSLVSWYHTKGSGYHSRIYKILQSLSVSNPDPFSARYFAYCKQILLILRLLFVACLWTKFFQILVINLDFILIMQIKTSIKFYVIIPIMIYKSSQK